MKLGFAKLLYSARVEILVRVDTPNLGPRSETEIPLSCESLLSDMRDGRTSVDYGKEH